MCLIPILIYIDTKNCVQVVNTDIKTFTNRNLYLFDKLHLCICKKGMPD